MHGDTQLWCAGLPLIGDRRLGREEQEQLRQAAWRLLWSGLASFLAVLALGVLLIALTAIAGARWDGTLFVIAILVAALMLFLPATLFAREGWFQRGLLLFRDLRVGHIRVFEGVLTQADLLETADSSDATQRRLVALGLLTFGTGQAQKIEVLPVSRRVWRVGGARARPWVEARWKEVSSSPAAASPWQYTDGMPAPSGTMGRRKLSTREQAELYRETHQHWLRPFIPALLLTVLFLVLLVSALSVRPLPKFSEWWGLIHVTWITVAADVFFLRRWAQARQMYQDARNGEVRASLGSITDDGIRSYGVRETLPASGRTWTEAGKPAAWRRIASSRQHAGRPLRMNDYMDGGDAAEENDDAIPGASMQGLDLVRIRNRHPEAVQEIEQIGKCLDVGGETEADLLRLGQLLHDVGEIRISEQFLRDNVVQEGDRLHRLYIGLHGSGAERRLEEAVRSFGALFGLHLTEQSPHTYLQRTCYGEPTSWSVTEQTVRDLLDREIDDEQVGALARKLSVCLAGSCRVDFAYEDTDEVGADLSSAVVDRERPAAIPGAEYVFSFAFRENRWTLAKW